MADQRRRGTPSGRSRQAAGSGRKPTGKSSARSASSSARSQARSKAAATSRKNPPSGGKSARPAGKSARPANTSARSSTSSRQSTARRQPATSPAVRTKRPAPRRPRRRLRVGRIVLLLVALALLVGLIWGGIALYQKFASSPKTAAQAQPKVTVAPTSAEGWAALKPEERYALLKGKEVLPCPADSYSITASAAAAGSGSHALTVTTTSTYPIPCTVGDSEQPFVVKISSGDQPVWSTLGCEGTSQTLLLSPNEPAKTVIPWPHVVRPTGCEGGSAAGPGTYRVEVTAGQAQAETTLEVKAAAPAQEAPAAEATPEAAPEN